MDISPPLGFYPRRFLALNIKQAESRIALIFLGGGRKKKQGEKKKNAQKTTLNEKGGPDQYLYSSKLKHPLLYVLTFLFFKWVPAGSSLKDWV